ncbi:hypothetical protein [Xenorhabdus sp. NBAII XenSa04]|uniref:hypothetical protein n=1 Tax=Xenorhabdus TaxID=626 RepID=UPI000B2436B7
MKKFLRIKTWFVRFFSPDKKTLRAIGEDLRKVAVTAIGVGIVGLAVSGDTITVKEVGLVLVIGVILYLNQGQQFLRGQMDVFTLGMLGLFIFFTVVTGGSLYLYHERQKEKSITTLK